MKIQLHNYFQQSLPRQRNIDSKLKPLLQNIKNAKINSIHQLSTELQTLVDQRILTTTLQNQSKRVNFRKYYSQNSSRSPQKSKSCIHNTPRIAKLTSKNEEIPFYNSASKIKKHLIEKMRFQNLEQTLNLNDKTNRFKYFIENLLEKRTCRSETKRHHKNDRVKLVNNQQAQQYFADYSRENEDNLFKVKIRKRFWKRESKLIKKKEMLNELCIKGMKQMAITIE